MKTAAIITAKGGNTSLPNKNLIPILGHPVMCYPIRAARLASKIDSVYVSTEDARIADVAEKEGANVIHRPQELSNPESQHADVIEHATREILDRNSGFTHIVILLGNTVHISPGLIDQCIELLKPGLCDSVLSAWKAQDDHPYRAMTVNQDGYVKQFQEIECGSNRQSYPDVYFYDQGIWAFESHCALERQGPIPWVWLGQKCKMVERPWVTGRDIHTWIDVSASSWYLTSIQANDFQNYEALS